MVTVHLTTKDGWFWYPRSAPYAYITAASVGTSFYLHLKNVITKAGFKWFTNQTTTLDHQLRPSIADIQLSLSENGKEELPNNFKDISINDLTSQSRLFTNFLGLPYVRLFQIWF